MHGTEHMTIESSTNKEFQGQQLFHNVKKFKFCLLAPDALRGRGKNSNLSAMERIISDEKVSRRFYHLLETSD